MACDSGDPPNDGKADRIQMNLRPADLDFRHPEGGLYSEPSLTDNFSIEKSCRIILIHGFRNSRPKALESYDKFKSYFEMANSLYAHKVFSLLWPGDEIGWNVPKYFLDNAEKAGEAGRALGRLLHRIIAREEHGCRFVIVAHSLGCRLSAEMMQELWRLDPSACKRFSLFLMAGALPESELAQSGALRSGLENASYVANFFSQQDGVLKKWFPVGYFAGGAGFPSEAIGLNGKPSDFGWSVLARMTDYDHEDYWNTSSVAKAVAAWVGTVVVTTPTANVLAAHRPEVNELPDHTL